MSENPTPKLEGRNICLRPFQLGDARDVYAYASNPKVANPCGFVPATVLEESQAIVQSFVQIRNQWAIWHPEDRRVIGSISLVKDWLRPDMETKMLGYTLSEAYWNRGIMTEAVGLVIDYAFQTLRLDGLSATTFIDNPRSQRILEKHHFSFEGVLEEAVTSLVTGAPIPYCLFYLGAETYEANRRKNASQEAVLCQKKASQETASHPKKASQEKKTPPLSPAPNTPVSPSLSASEPYVGPRLFPSRRMAPSVEEYYQKALAQGTYQILTRGRQRFIQADLLVDQGLPHLFTTKDFDYNSSHHEPPLVDLNLAQAQALATLGYAYPKDLLSQLSKEAGIDLAKELENKGEVISARGQGEKDPGPAGSKLKTCKGLWMAYQVHGDRVVWVDQAKEPEDFERPGFARRIHECDGLLTTQAGTALAAKVADCVPLILYEPKAKILACVHSGWRGTAQGIVGQAIAKILGLGGNRRNIYVAVGPHIGAKSFEIDQPVLEYLAQKKVALPPFALQLGEKAGHAYLDLGAILMADLLAWGIDVDHVGVLDLDTVTEVDLLHSYRREKEAFGTMLALGVLP